MIFLIVALCVIAFAALVFIVLCLTGIYLNGGLKTQPSRIEVKKARVDSLFYQAKQQADYFASGQPRQYNSVLNETWSQW